MSIIVVCPECRKTFKVSDKFAGKSGACPNCKHTLEVPAKAQEVTVHAPTKFAEGGRGTSGKLLLKPVAYDQPKIEPVNVAIIAAASLAAIAVAWLGGRMGLFQNPIALAVGLLLVSPPLAAGAYTVLRNDELEPYRGKALYIRSGLCGLAYVVLWGVFAMLAARGVVTGDVWIWLFVLPPFMVAGGMLSMAALDLDFGNGLFHYVFYVMVTVLLHRIAGLKWVWDMTV